MNDSDHAGAGFTIDQANTMRAELEREIDQRVKFYPGMIAKQRLTQAEADSRIAIMREMLTDLGRALHPDPRQRRELPLADRAFSWREKIGELERELTMRRKVYPARVAKARMTQAEMDSRIETLQLVHDLYWRRQHCWEPDGPAARDAHAQMIKRFDETGNCNMPETAGLLSMRLEFATHFRAVLPPPPEQQELGV